MLIKSIIEITGASLNDSQMQLELDNSQNIWLVERKLGDKIKETRIISSGV